MKNFAMLVELTERQVLLMKASREDEEDEDGAPWLITCRFLLKDGSQSDVNLGFTTEEKRDQAFQKLLNDPKMAQEKCRKTVDSVKWMEDALTSEEE